MRLFTGIDLSQEVRMKMEELLLKLRPQADIKWSAAENLHITTKFIGEWPQEKLEDLKTALGGVPVPPAFDIAIRGLGWFPNPHSPRVLWAGIEAPSALGDLARATEQRLEQIGIAAEQREFSPHLTLARIKGPKALGGLRRTIAALDSVEFGQVRADRFHLYLSERSRAGSRYHRLAGFPLASA